MLFSRFVVIATGLIFGSYGIGCVIDPALPAEYMGVALGDAGGKVEFMAMYGGLQAGLGGLLIYLGCKAEQVDQGLKLIIVIIGSLATVRIAGLVVHGTDDYNFGAACYEATTTILALVALKLKK
jgi:hypothetical protein